MSKESREHLSCFMDGEISRETGRFLVRRLGADRELRETWARYHLVRDCLRHQEGGLAGSNLGIDLCGRVQQVLAGEAPQVVPGRFTARLLKGGLLKGGLLKGGWLKPVAGMAVAASVALMAIMIVGPGQSPVNAPPGDLAASPQAESFVSPNNVLTPSPRSEPASVLGGSGSSSRKMHSYLLRHYQVAGSTGGKGFVSFVPIVVTHAAAQADAQTDPKGDLQDDPGDSAEEGENSLDKNSLSRANESTRQ